MLWSFYLVVLLQTQMFQPFSLARARHGEKREKGRGQDEALNWANYLLRKLINQTSLPLFINI